MKVANKQPGYPETFKTLRQWRYLGLVPGEGRNGEECWTNAHCQHTAVYYHKEDMQPAEGEELAAIKIQIEARRNHKKDLQRRWHRKQRGISRLKKAAESTESLPCDNPSRAIAFAFATTGVCVAQDDILQISIIDGDGNTLFDEYVHPILKESWKNAQAENGISPEMVAEAPYPHKLVPKLRGIFESADLYISYGGKHDMDFLNYWGIRPSGEHFDVLQECSKMQSKLAATSETGRSGEFIEYAKHHGYEYNGYGCLENAKAALYCYKKLTGIDTGSA